MTTLKTVAFGMGLMMFAMAAWAGDADVCYSQGKSSSSTNRLKDTTMLVCGHAGTHSLTELAKDGWSIVSVTQDMEPGLGGVSWMVVIQKQ